MNILDTANKIVNERNEEKERQYGPFEEGMEKAAKIASLISGKDITADDVYIIMMSLKLSRQSYNKKEDNLLDLVAYAGAWQNKINNEK
jgi:DNA-binding protein H-NS